MYLLCNSERKQHFVTAFTLYSAGFDKDAGLWSQAIRGHVCCYALRVSLGWLTINQESHLHLFFIF